MKILSTDQIRELDSYTIEHANISSHDLMERAAGACCDWIENNYPKETPVWIFCGPGNNGGDGLAIARILYKSGFKVKVWAISSEKKSSDFLKNENLLKETDLQLLQEIRTENDFPFIPENVLVIDALFGTRISKPVIGLFASLINYLNDSAAEIVAIDLPSGLFADVLPEPTQAIIKAKHTLSFQLPKFSFLFPSTNEFVGEWHLLNIGLSQKYINNLLTDLHYLSLDEMKGLLKPRNKFSHKGTYGHALLISGSKGKMGAAVIAASACLRCGVGLLTVQVPASGVAIIQTCVPEAMAIADVQTDIISTISDLDAYNAIGIGPGTGTDKAFVKVLENVLMKNKHPLVLDADALNCLSLDPKLLEYLPENSILTPHIKEFERIAGKSTNDSDRYEKQKLFSKMHKVIIVLKGAHTCITAPDGRVFFNSTGNPGMAKGGCGDALTGVILSFLAQGYSPLESAQLSVFIHGIAGDIAKEKFTEYSMTAMDLVLSLGEAFKIV